MDEYVKLAKQAIELFVKEAKILTVPSSLPTEFHSKKAGIFVTIFKKGELRGCIGTYLPHQANLAKEIINNAVAACSQDWRFGPVEEGLLPLLCYEVSVLNQPQPFDRADKHNPKIHGLIVKTSDGRCGLLLPDLKEVETLNQQIAICCQKGGINAKTDALQLYRFTVEKHK